MIGSQSPEDEQIRQHANETRQADCQHFEM